MASMIATMNDDKTTNKKRSMLIDGIIFRRFLEFSTKENNFYNTQNSSSEQNTMDWDDLCWNPHESSLQQGEAEGLEAGRFAGYRDGQALGWTKGLEFGMELGFIKGFLNHLQEDCTQRSNRVLHSIERLKKALEDESLHPDQIFRDQQHAAQELKNSYDDSEDDSKLNVVAKMQRIRARFKVICVQIGIPRFSLKEIMDDAAEASSSTSPEENKGDSEW
jgi:hypothetical protein